MAGNSNLSAIKIPNAPIGELENFAEQVKLMYDLLGLAYQADLTRVATYVTVAEGTNRTLSVLDVADGFHPVSHHGDISGAHREADQDPESGTCRCSPTSSRRWGTPPGRPGLSLLDHAIFMYGSNNEQLEPAQQLPDSEPDRRRQATAS